MPNVFETTDALATIGTTYTLGVGETGQGNISTLGDHDWWRVNLQAGQQYTFALVGTTFNGVADPFLRLRDAAGTQIAFDDDTGPGITSSVTFTATTTGAYFLDAGAFNNESIGQYGISVIEGPRASYDFMMGAGALIRDHKSWSPTAATAVNVTWSVSASNAAQTDAQANPTAFIAPSAAQIATLATCLTQFSDISNITFTQISPGGTSNDATIRLSAYNSTTDGAGAYAYFPGPTDAGDNAGNVNLNNDSVSTTDLPQGSYSFFAILHELGHAMGLAHPGDYNAAPGVDITYATHAQFTQDSQQYSVMSYFDESNTTDSYNSYPDTLLMFDILATQQLYGINNTTRAGNSIYGFGANTGAVYDFALNIDPAFCIWDGAGIDKIDASGFSQAQLIDLRDGRFSDIGGVAGNVSIAIGAVIENATGGSGADMLIGNAASNTLNGMGAADIMDGGAGNDLYYVDNAGDQVIEASAVGGTDRVLASLNYTLGAAARVEILSTTNSAGLAAINLIGNAFAQTIYGNAGANIIDGRGGADTLSGLGGNDIYYVDNASDSVIEAAAGGSDRVYTSVSYTLTAAAQVEFMATTSTAASVAINLTGNGFAQAIYGNAGANIIDGKGGADAMVGFGGNDWYTVRSAGDQVFEAVGGGSDRVYCAVSYTLAAAAEVEFLATNGTTGSGAINLTGNAFAQSIYGNAGANIIDGRGGADGMAGNGGNDIYYVDNAGDSISEVAGGGSDRVYTSVSYTLTAAARVEFLATNNSFGSGAINLTGNGFAQAIYGNAGANIINGKGGADGMVGNGGADIFVFDTTLGAGNIDTIADYNVAADTIRIDDAVFAGAGFIAGQFIAASAFAIGAAATTVNQHIIYNNVTGDLIFDSNGNGVGGSQVFAHLAAGLNTMTNADFFVV